MAQAAAAAAEAAGDIQLALLRAEEASMDALLAADTYLFACPENLASMSGEMKAFFDRSYYPLLGRIEGKSYAAMICAGSDGEGAARQIARIATGWRLRAVAPPLIVITHAQSEEAILAPKLIPDSDLARCRDLGASLAAGMALGIY